MYYENYDPEEHESPPRIYSSIYADKTDLDFRDAIDVKDIASQEIVQRNAVEVEGIPPEYCKEKLLCSYSYFGQYGKVPKIEIIQPIKRGRANKKQKKEPQQEGFDNYNGQKRVRVTYKNTISASLAIYGLDNLQVRRFGHRRLSIKHAINTYCPEFINKTECQDLKCNMIHYIAKASDYADYENRKIQNQKDYSLRDININRLDLTNSFFFDTNTIFPSITSVLRKIERFTNRKDIFELQVLCDPEGVCYPEVYTFEESYEDEKMDDDEKTNSLSESEFSSNSEEEEEQDNVDLPSAKLKPESVVQTDPGQSRKHDGEEEAPKVKCKCPSCIIERNSYRWCAENNNTIGEYETSSRYSTGYYQRSYPQSQQHQYQEYPRYYQQTPHYHQYTGGNPYSTYYQQGTAYGYGGWGYQNQSDYQSAQQGHHRGYANFSYGSQNTPNSFHNGYYYQ